MTISLHKGQYGALLLAVAVSIIYFTGVNAIGGKRRGLTSILDDRSSPLCRLVGCGICNEDSTKCLQCMDDDTWILSDDGRCGKSLVCCVTVTLRDVQEPQFPICS